MEKQNVISKKQSDSLYSSLKFMHDTLTANKIKYFIIGGTLLGAVRHQGIIPHDHDGDIAIFKKDVPKLRRLKKIFMNNGYILGQQEEEEPYYKKHNDVITWYVESRFLSCDIFIMEEYKNGKINYSDPGWRQQDSLGGKTCYIESIHLYPLIPYRFGNFWLYGPNNAIPHLNKCYGEDWSSRAYENGKKKVMKVNDYLTLKPPKYTKDDTPPPMIFTQANKKFFESPTRSRYF